MIRQGDLHIFLKDDFQQHLPDDIPGSAVNTDQLVHNDIPGSAVNTDQLVHEYIAFHLALERSTTRKQS